MTAHQFMTSLRHPLYVHGDVASPRYPQYSRRRVGGVFAATLAAGVAAIAVSLVIILSAGSSSEPSAAFVGSSPELTRSQAAQVTSSLSSPDPAVRSIARQVIAGEAGFSALAGAGQRHHPGSTATGASSTQELDGIAPAVRHHHFR